MVLLTAWLNERLNEGIDRLIDWSSDGSSDWLVDWLIFEPFLLVVKLYTVRDILSVTPIDLRNASLIRPEVDELLRSVAKIWWGSPLNYYRGLFSNVLDVPSSMRGNSAAKFHGCFSIHSIGNSIPCTLILRLSVTGSTFPRWNPSRSADGIFRRSRQRKNTDLSRAGFEGSAAGAFWRIKRRYVGSPD